jgi:hypothetical protein
MQSEPDDVTSTPLLLETTWTQLPVPTVAALASGALSGTEIRVNKKMKARFLASLRFKDARKRERKN